MGSNLILVGSWVAVETVGEGTGNDFHKIVVALQVLGQQNQVATGVMLVGMGEQRFVGNIHLTPENRFEDFLAKLLHLSAKFGHLPFVAAFLCLGKCRLGILYGTLGLAVLFVYKIKELLYAEHVSMVGYGDSRHTVGHCLVDKSRNGSLTVKDRILCVDVEMYEWFHRRYVVAASGKEHLGGNGVENSERLLNSFKLFVKKNGCPPAGKQPQIYENNSSPPNGEWGLRMKYPYRS